METPPRAGGQYPTDTRITKEGGAGEAAREASPWAFLGSPRPAFPSVWLCVSFLVYSALVSSINPARTTLVLVNIYLVLRARLGRRG